ncbi:MAG: cysteine--tRNA ligase [Cellvibrionaceae bacterium]|nr:cysteine--tRNA ligase [Cellvibrionaceae bacterium]
MNFTLYNTLKRSKESFRPLKDKHINMYVCGMTVYDYCHIGHARLLVAFDVITRFLRAQGWQVNYVRNITDIDDKILNRARENGEAFESLSERFIAAMHEDEAKLNILRPDAEPRATAHIHEIIQLIEVLHTKDYAYRAENGDVYYRVSKFADYGKLSNKNSEELLAGARIAVEEQKHDPRDFVLWKSAKPGEVSWPSPWGPGRPGWHIECSAMTKACLGETMDIHGGGPDLPFPHHENEIAQSEAANGCTLANYWMHAGAVRIDGEKMSKSLNNFFTVRDVLKQYHPEIVRFLLVSCHYRSPINYSEENLLEAKTGLERFYFALRGYEKVAPQNWQQLGETEAGKKFIDAMSDDFNSRLALVPMYELIRDINQLKASDNQAAEQAVASLKAMGGILGILQADPNQVLQGSSASKQEGELSAADIEQMIEQRHQAKLAKNYGLADQIREQLTAAGVVLEDSRSGTTWRRQ